MGQIHYITMGPHNCYYLILGLGTHQRESEQLPHLRIWTKFCLLCWKWKKCENEVQTEDMLPRCLNISIELVPYKWLCNLILLHLFLYNSACLWSRSFDFGYRMLSHTHTHNWNIQALKYRQRRCFAAIRKAANIIQRWQTLIWFVCQVWYKLNEIPMTILYSTLHLTIKTDKLFVKTVFLIFFS